MGIVIPFRKPKKRLHLMSHLVHWERILPKGSYRGIRTHIYTIDKTLRGLWVAIDHGPADGSGTTATLLAHCWKLSDCKDKVDERERRLTLP